MPTHLNRRRRDTRHHRLLDYRLARDQAHEDLAAWFLGPSPDDHAERERERWAYYLDNRPQPDRLLAQLQRIVEGEALALQHRAQPATGWPALRARLAAPAPECPAGIATGREQAADARTDADADRDPPPDAAEPLCPPEVAALEQLLVRWAQALVSDAAQLADGVHAVPGAAAALRALARRHLGGPTTLARLSHDDEGWTPWARALALAALTHPLWVRAPEQWAGGSPRSLLAHLLQDFAVPPILWRWLLGGPLNHSPADPNLWGGLFPDEHARQCRLQALPLVWWATRAAGGSVHRVLKQLAWPEVTLSAADIAAMEALPSRPARQPEFGRLLTQARFVRLGGGLSDWQRLQRLAPPDDRRITTLGLPPVGPPMRRRLAVLAPAQQREGLQWLLRHPHLLRDDGALAEVLAWWLHRHDLACGAARAPFSWVGRSAAAVQAAARHHAEQRRRVLEGLSAAWPAQGWDCSLADPAGDPQPWHARELTDTDALHAEGAAQRHCVGTYALDCVLGRSAIVQLCHGPQRVLTLEVDVPGRRVVQARGRFNAMPDAVARQVLTDWAAACGLGVAC